MRFSKNLDLADLPKTLEDVDSQLKELSSISQKAEDPTIAKEASSAIKELKTLKREIEKVLELSNIT